MSRKPHLAAMDDDALKAYEDRLWIETAAVTAERALRRYQDWERATDPEKNNEALVPPFADQN